MTGCSDASIKTFYLVTYPKGQASDLVPPMRGLTFKEMLEADAVMAPRVRAIGGVEERDEVLVIEKARQCWASCCCPLGLTKPDTVRCARCCNRGHTELVRSLSLSERVILSGSYDSSVKVRDVEGILCSQTENAVFRL